MNSDWLIPKQPPSDRVLHELSQHYPDVDPSAVQAWVSLLRVALELHGVSNEHFARYHLSEGRFVVLIMLHTTPGGEMCCSDVAESTGVSRATVTGLVDGLERDGLVRRVDYPEDRRRITITLTANGRRLLDQLLPDHMRRIASVMSNLSKSDRKALRTLLEKVRAGVASAKTPDEGEGHRS
jgi:DNA-binding MarR family transcriptional regulator